MRRALWCIAAPVLLVAAWFAAGLAGALIPGAVATHPGGGDPVTVGLVAGPIHYDILLPLTPALRSRFAFAAGGGVGVDAPDAEWLLVGWGAREFYRSTGRLADMTTGPVARAIIGDRSVLRFEAYGAIDPASPALRMLPVSPAGFEAIVARIEADLGRDAGGAPRLSRAPGLTTTDAFWEAEGVFSAIRTCNVWVGEVLRGAGLRLGIWTPTPQALALSLWWFGG